MPLYLHENRQETQARVPHHDFFFAISRNPGSPNCNTVRIATSFLLCELPRSAPASTRSGRLRFILILSSLSLSPCPLRQISSGFSHLPDSADRNTASITAIFAIASSSGTGTSLPSRIARENASPCTVYWLQVGITSVITPLPRASLPSSTRISHGRSFGALKGILISIRPFVPRNCMRWYRTSCVPHVNTDCPEGNSNIAEASRSVPNSGSLSAIPATRNGSSPKTQRDVVIG